MPRSQTPAAERKEQRNRIVGRASKDAGTAVTVRESQQILRDRNKGGLHLPAGDQDTREFVVRGITGYQTRDRVLDYRDDEVRFIGDIQAEIADLKVYRGGYVVLNLQVDDEHLQTLTDAVRLSRAHPLFLRLFELFPKPEGPWADGTHPDDTHESTPGHPHSHPSLKAVTISEDPDLEWEVKQ